jgi:hypothetical protein
VGEAASEGTGRGVAEPFGTARCCTTKMIRIAHGEPGTEFGHEDTSTEVCSKGCSVAAARILETTRLEPIRVVETSALAEPCDVS